jgi:hypothetical protein
LARDFIDALSYTCYNHPLKLSYAIFKDFAVKREGARERVRGTERGFESFTLPFSLPFLSLLNALGVLPKLWCIKIACAICSWVHAALAVASNDLQLFLFLVFVKLKLCNKKTDEAECMRKHFQSRLAEGRSKERK